MSKIIGRNLKLTLGNKEIINARDCTINRSRNMIDATTRANKGKEAVEYGRRSETIDFDVVVDSTDTSLAQLRTAWDEGTKLSISVLTSFGTETGQGCVETLNESQPEDDVVKLDVTIHVDGGLTKS